MKDVVTSSRLDSNETIWFVEQLNHVKARAYQKKYPELKGANGVLFPISSEADPADETITYEFYNEVGIGAIIANYADDLPRVNVKAERFTSDIRGVGESYEYSLMDIRKGTKTGKSLPQRKANAARRANDQKVNRIAWYGDAEYNLIGLFNNPNITAGEVQVGAVSGNKKWENKNPDEILLDMNDAINDTLDLTNGVEMPNMLILPIKQYTLVSTTRLAAGTDTTILQFFKNNQPEVMVDRVVELKDVDPLPSGATGPKDCMVSYVRDEEHLSLEIPQAFEQLPVQEINLAYVVNCHSRCGGIIVPYPLAVNIVEGI